jgi:hypothetical protein
MPRSTTFRTSAAHTERRRLGGDVGKISSLAGADSTSDLDITNVVERELQTDNYIDGKSLSIIKFHSNKSDFIRNHAGRQF